jgi:EAL domain-containing protein (putative c-di-GMP-specific phosphodiesterase class I)
LRSQTIKIYLDDFGTGYSSLSYLLHFPVDVLKIDMSFVEWMHIDEQSEHIVKSVIDMAHNMKMKVVAEGVSEEEHIKMLKKWNCDYVQGYFYSKPLPAKNAVDYIKTWS